MAFFFLFTGLLVGASIISLSESERDYYYSNRYNMTYLGNKDGLDVFRDNHTGQFYVDDGWDVSRVGTAGFTPHPVDRERLKALCAKFNPQNVPWVDFMLASFEGREDQLWRNFFEKYELGPKPKEPTWGKGIRKARWAQYDESLQQWEERRKALLPQFESECRQWAEKRRNYDNEYQAQVSSNAGRIILQRALSGGTIPTVIVQTPSTMTYKAVIPAGAAVGSTFLVNAGGQTMAVRVPEGGYPGKEISFQGPPMQAQVIQSAPRPAETVNVTSVPAAIPPKRSEPAAYVPPAMSAPPPPAIQGNAVSVPVALAPPSNAAAVPSTTASASQSLPRKSSIAW